MKIFKTNIGKSGALKIFDLLVTVTGIILIGIGMYMIYKPLMFMVIGIIFVFPGIPAKVVK